MWIRYKFIRWLSSSNIQPKSKPEKTTISISGETSRQLEIYCRENGILRKDFVSLALEYFERTGFNLKSNALDYSPLEKKTGKRGHPKWFDGRIDFANLVLTRCKEYEVNKGKLYGLRVYAKALKRYVSLSVWYPMDGRSDKWQLYFSTDDSMDGREVLDYYRTRFQLEFCFRDGKQHTGIINCQSTDFRKLDFHFNASLATGNLAKAACKRLGITYSISNCKSFIHNAYMLERFICVFGINPDPQVIDKLFKELILFTARSA